MTPPRLLVTGFGPFGEHARNPSAMIACAVDGSVVEGVAVVGAVLPVSWSGAFDALRQAVDRTRPDALLMLGVALRPTFCFEVVARNVQGPRADALGMLPERALVEPGGAQRLTSRLPWSRLRTGPLPARYSDDAGDYLCNHLLYRALSACPEVGVRGFVHVPPLVEAGLPHGHAWPVIEAAGRDLVESLARCIGRPGATSRG